jgi:transcription initiation factor IIF auxiliary subunit
MNPLRIEQETSYAGDGYWNWSVWLEGPLAELDRIKFVEYRLDPSFPNPVRRILDRGSKFKLATGGWGEFIIYAVVTFRDDSRHSIDYRLRLKRPLEQPVHS